MNAKGYNMWYNRIIKEMKFGDRYEYINHR